MAADGSMLFVTKKHQHEQQHLTKNPEAFCGGKGDAIWTCDILRYLEMLSLCRGMLRLQIRSSQDAENDDGLELAGASRNVCTAWRRHDMTRNDEK